MLGTDVRWAILRFRVGFRPFLHRMKRLFHGRLESEEPIIPVLSLPGGLLFASQRFFRKQQRKLLLQATRGRIVKTWKLCVVAVVVCLWAGIAMAANPVAPDTTASLTPGGTAAICTNVCYCPRPMPCLGCPPCDGICVQYCPRPMPCLGCLPCDGICVQYCPRPMPCLCTPIARPENCEMPSCFGVGR
jgi:hypothetical protein